MYYISCYKLRNRNIIWWNIKLISISHPINSLRASPRVFLNFTLTARVFLNFTLTAFCIKIDFLSLTVFLYLIFLYLMYTLENYFRYLYLASINAGWLHLDNYLEKLMESIFPSKSLFERYRESLGVALISKLWKVVKK
jgi:hypothetical protein